MKRVSVNFWSILGVSIFLAACGDAEKKKAESAPTGATPVVSASRTLENADEIRKTQRSGETNSDAVKNSVGSLSATDMKAMLDAAKPSVDPVELAKLKMQQNSESKADTMELLKYLFMFQALDNQREMTKMALDTAKPESEEDCEPASAVGTDMKNIGINVILAKAIAGQLGQ